MADENNSTRGGAIGVGRSAILRRFEVTGQSMEPTFVAGDRLLVFTRGRKPRVGDVVVFIDPRHNPSDPASAALADASVERGVDAPIEMVKRVAAVHADGSVDVAGDNPAASTDSRTFGAVPAKSLRGRVLRKY